MPSSMNVLPPNRAVRLDNRTCLYCGLVEAEENPFTVEHVVGRRFVPKGSLDKSWALIGNACLRCNNKKSDLGACPSSRWSSWGESDSLRGYEQGFSTLED
ncbi:5-methylcytosine-specific restriction endonuclease McrA [Bradyrhizobium sp. LM2.7]